MNWLGKLSFTGFLTLGVGLLIRSSTASFEPPNKVWWADCQSAGMVKICRQGGNQSNLTIQYDGFLIAPSNSPKAPNHYSQVEQSRSLARGRLEVYIKLNGHLGVFAILPDRMDSAQLVLGSRYSSCRKSGRGEMICVESASEVQNLFSGTVSLSDSSNWSVEVFFVDPATGRRDDNLGRNFSFTLQSKAAS